MTKIEYISMLHKQNLNGRETEDELFELGIKYALEEVEEHIKKRIIELSENIRIFKKYNYNDLIEIAIYNIEELTRFKEKFLETDK